LEAGGETSRGRIHEFSGSLTMVKPLTVGT